MAMVIGLLIGTMVLKSKPMDTSRVVETLKKGVLKNYLDKSEFKARTKNYATKGYVASYVKKRMVKPKSKKKAKVTKKRKSSRSKKRRRRVKRVLEESPRSPARAPGRMAV